MRTNIKINRGDIWLIDLDPTVGHEQAKRRPCVIISNDSYNNGPADMVVILSITSRFRPVPWYVSINPPEGGLKKISYIICDQIRCVSLIRFEGSFWGTLTPKTMQAVEKRIAHLLNLSTVIF